MNPVEIVENTFLENEFLGASVYAWLVALALWAGTAAVLILLNRFVAWKVGRIAERTSNQIDDYVAALLKETRVYFLIVASLYFTSLILELPGALDRWISTIAFLVFMVQIVIWGTRLAAFWTERYREEKLATDAGAVTTVVAIGWLIRVALWAFVFLLILDYFGKDITALVAGLGIGGIAIALAVQNILGDLFASLSIVLDRPFVVGDFVAVNDFLGTVEHVGLKTTRIRSISGEQIIFSNGDLLQSRIRNYKRMFERRIVFTLGVTYQTPHEKIAAIPAMLREIVERQDQVRFDRAHFKGFGDFALNFEVVYYVLTPEYLVYMDIQQAINLAVHERFSSEGIDFAFPTQSLFVESIPGGLRLNDGERMGGQIAPDR